MNKEEIKAFAKEIASEAITQTQEAFSVMMNDKMDQMHRDAMIMVEQIRDDNMIFGEAISGLSDKFDKMSNRLDTMDERFDAIDNRFNAMDERFDGIDQRFDGIDQRFDGIDGSINGLTNGVKEIKEILIKNLDKRVHVLEVGGKQMVVNS